MAKSRRSPPKARALTRTLDQAGSRKVPVDGKQTSRRQLLAAMVWDYVTLGSATLPNGAPLTIPLKDWFAVVKWLYGQIDGAPKAAPADPDDGGGVMRMEWVDPFDDQDDPNQDDPDAEAVPDL